MVFDNNDIFANDSNPGNSADSPMQNTDESVESLYNKYAKTKDNKYVDSMLHKMQKTIKNGISSYYGA